MIKKYRALIITIIVMIIYIGIQLSPLVRKKETGAPIITFDINEMIVSVHDSESVLLQGVKATDEEDGDLTDSIMIENQSIFTSGNTRTVSYLVFDSDDHVTRASRQITYYDYTAPKFSLTDSLYQDTYSVTKLMENLHATSSVDGDISSKITVMNTLYEEDYLKLKVSVTDSTNTTSFLNINYNIQEKQSIEIVLQNYLVYLNVGEGYDYRSNIINVIEKNFQNPNLANYIDIEVPVMNEPGIYEVNYSLSLANGNSGRMTMIVVVE